MNKFWLVYVEGGLSHATKHATHETAKLEAERRARQESKPVYLLEAIAKCSTSSPPVHWELP